MSGGGGGGGGGGGDSADGYFESEPVTQYLDEADLDGVSRRAARLPPHSSAHALAASTDGTGAWNGRLLFGGPCVKGGGVGSSSGSGGRRISRVAGSGSVCSAARLPC